VGVHSGSGTVSVADVDCTGAAAAAATEGSSSGATNEAASASSEYRCVKQREHQHPREPEHRYRADSKRLADIGGYHPASPVPVTPCANPQGDQQVRQPADRFQQASLEWCRSGVTPAASSPGVFSAVTAVRPVQRRRYGRTTMTRYRHEVILFNIKL
jgi:hypothetical protein